MSLPQTGCPIWADLLAAHFLGVASWRVIVPHAVALVLRSGPVYQTTPIRASVHSPAGTLASNMTVLLARMVTGPTPVLHQPRLCAFHSLSCFNSTWYSGAICRVLGPASIASLVYPR